MNTTTIVVVAGIAFLLIFLSGFWLNRKGRPLNQGLSAAHKLISLAAGIYLLYTIYQRNKLVPLGMQEWIAIAVTGLCFLGTVASGALLSADKPAPAALLRVHQVVPVLTLLASGLTLYMLLGL